MSLRWGTSSGFSRREKLLLVTGTALTRANSATPQLVEGETCARGSGSSAQRRATVKSITRTFSHARHAAPRPLTQLEVQRGRYHLRRQLELFQLDLAAGLLELG